MHAVGGEGTPMWREYAQPHVWFRNMPFMHDANTATNENPTISVEASWRDELYGNHKNTTTSGQDSGAGEPVKTNLLVGIAYKTNPKNGPRPDTNNNQLSEHAISVLNDKSRHWSASYDTRKVVYDDPAVRLTYDELSKVDLKGLPIRANHDSTKRVGQVVHASVDAETGELLITASIDDPERCAMMSSGKMKEGSLSIGFGVGLSGHTVKEKTISEISCVQRPFYEECRVKIFAGLDGETTTNVNAENMELEEQASAPQAAQDNKSKPNEVNQASSGSLQRIPNSAQNSKEATTQQNSNLNNKENMATTQQQLQQSMNMDQNTQGGFGGSQLTQQQQQPMQTQQQLQNFNQQENNNNSTPAGEIPAENMEQERDIDDSRSNGGDQHQQDGREGVGESMETEMESDHHMLDETLLDDTYINPNDRKEDLFRKLQEMQNAMRGIKQKHDDIQALAQVGESVVEDKVNNLMNSKFHDLEGDAVEEMREAVTQVLRRNPNAFKSQLGNSSSSPMMSQQQQNQPPQKSDEVKHVKFDNSVTSSDGARNNSQQQQRRGSSATSSQQQQNNRNMNSGYRTQRSPAPTYNNQRTNVTGYKRTSSVLPPTTIGGTPTKIVKTDANVAVAASYQSMGGQLHSHQPAPKPVAFTSPWISKDLETIFNEQQQRQELQASRYNYGNGQNGFSVTAGFDIARSTVDGTPFTEALTILPNSLYQASCGPTAMREIPNLGNIFIEASMTPFEAPKTRGVERVTYSATQQPWTKVDLNRSFAVAGKDNMGQLRVECSEHPASNDFLNVDDFTRADVAKFKQTPYFTQGGGAKNETALEIMAKLIEYNDRNTQLAYQTDSLANEHRVAIDSIWKNARNQPVK